MKFISSLIVILNLILLCLEVDGQWLTFPFPFVHHQPLNFSLWPTVETRTLTSHKGQRHIEREMKMTAGDDETFVSDSWTSSHPDVGYHSVGVSSFSILKT